MFGLLTYFARHSCLTHIPGLVVADFGWLWCISVFFKTADSLSMLQLVGKADIPTEHDIIGSFLCSWVREPSQNSHEKGVTPSANFLDSDHWVMLAKNLLIPYCFFLGWCCLPVYMDLSKIYQLLRYGRSCNWWYISFNLVSFQLSRCTTCLSRGVPLFTPWYIFPTSV